MSFLDSTAWLTERPIDRERRAMLRRLGEQGRLAAYRRGDLDLDACCLWAACYPREVPMLNGEFEFIALSTPEVCG